MGLLDRLRDGKSAPPAPVPSFQPQDGEGSEFYVYVNDGFSQGFHPFNSRRDAEGYECFLGSVYTHEIRTKILTKKEYEEALNAWWNRLNGR